MDKELDMLFGEKEKRDPSSVQFEMLRQLETVVPKQDQPLSCVMYSDGSGELSDSYGFTIDLEGLAVNWESMDEFYAHAKRIKELYQEGGLVDALLEVEDPPF